MKRMGEGVYCYGPQCTHSRNEWGRRVAHYVTKWDRTEVALDERRRARWQGESSLLEVERGRVVEPQRLTFVDLVGYH